MRPGLFAAGVLLGIMVTFVHGAESVYPGKEWATKSPAEVGLQIDKLKELPEYAGGSGCVVRHGYMVYTWGDVSRHRDVASAVKPLYTHFLLRAIQDGKLTSLDEPVSKCEPRLKDLNKDLGYKDREITWRHLCNQISCYGVKERPGEAFDYSDWNMALLFDTLFLKVYKTTWEKVDEECLRPMLTDILQCQDNPTFMAFGPGNRPGRFGVSTRDFARFALLYLRQGQWNGKEVLDKDLATFAPRWPVPIRVPRTKGEKAEMIPDQRSIGGGNNQCDHNGNYSNAWWINGVGRDGTLNWPDVPRDAFGCFGHGDIRASVAIPSLDIVVSWNDTKLEGHEKVNHALGLVVDAVTDSQTQAQTTRPRWLTHAVDGVAKPLFMCGPGDPEGFLYRGEMLADGTRKGDQIDLIEKLEAFGGNCIYLMAVRSHGGDGDKTHNPFNGNDPAKGINMRVLDQWEQWFTDMDKLGIVIYLFVYDDSALVWDTGDTVGEAEKKFLDTLVNRFEHHKNLVWCIAEEYGERLSAKRVSRIAAAIRAADDKEHPIAVHKNHGLDFSEFADDANFDQFAIQYNVSDIDELHAGVVQAWKQARGRYSVNMSECADHGTGKELRLRNWACAMGGAHVMVLGMDIAGTPQSDLEGCKRLVDFFESADWARMAPKDELAGAETKYVLAKPGECYIAYSPDCKQQIGLKNMTAGAYNLVWLDCATGKKIVQKNVNVDSGNASWPKPNGLGQEVALYIHRN